MKIDGRCHCGYITYEAEIDPEKVGICHCTDCQTLSGSAFRIGAIARDGTFRLLSGEPKIYVKTAESGAQRAQGFCPECGTAIFTSDTGDGPKSYRIRVATARQRDRLPPKIQGWHRSAQPWLGDLAAIPAVEKQPVPWPAKR
jgi:hypothetical protein